MNIARPGRPRRAEVDRAVQQATRELLQTNGFDALTMEAVAVRAGVAKSTVYRRYQSKAELVFASAIHDRSLATAQDCGSLAEDVRRLLRSVVRSMSDPAAGQAAIGLLSSLGDENMRQRFEDTFVAAEMAALVEVIERGQQRGEITGRPDVDLLHAQVVGAVMVRLLYRRQPAGPDFVDALAAQLVAGLRAGH